jgi:hypothetical protein
MLCIVILPSPFFGLVSIVERRTSEADSLQEITPSEADVVPKCLAPPKMPQLIDG